MTHKRTMSHLIVKRWRPLLGVLAGCVALEVIPGLIQLLFTGMTLPVLGISLMRGVVYACCIGIPFWAAVPVVLCRPENGLCRCAALR
jgi:hypothetical protein